MWIVLNFDEYVDSEGLLLCNFSPSIFKVLEEIVYFKKFRGEVNIPYSTLSLYASAEKLRNLREFVLIVAGCYNKNILSMSEEEKGLFGDYIKRIDKRISAGCSKVTWNSKNVKDLFLQNVKDQCDNLSLLLTEHQNYHNQLLKFCRRISIISLVLVNKNTVYEDSEFVHVQLKHIESSKLELQTIIADMLQIILNRFKLFEVFKFYYCVYIFKGDSLDVQKLWLLYVQNLDEKLLFSLRVCVRKSLHDLSRLINVDLESQPTFKVAVFLDEMKQKIEFKPALLSLQSTVNEIAKSIISSVNNIKRFSAEISVAAINCEILEFPSFFSIISEDQDVLKLVVNIMQGVTNISSTLNEMIKPWESQSYRQIWEVDKDLFMKRYASTKRTTFFADVTRYREFATEIAIMETFINSKFLRVDFSLLKSSFISHCVA